LMHDLAECVTGDIPSPAKREYGIGDQVSALESRLMRGADLPVYALTHNEERILKLADIAQGALFCLREIEMGNSKMRIILDRYMAYADSMVLVGRERELFDTIKEKM
jgi:5'-deoxynucleotidase YfbR-like HD superfamily hydrolase